MNITKIISRIEKLECMGAFNQEETIPLEEKMKRAEKLFVKYHNSSEPEQEEFLIELNILGRSEGKVFTHQEMCDAYKSFGTGGNVD